MLLNWADLVKRSSELATNQDYNLAESWLVDSNSPSNLPPADNPVSNPYGIVPDHHNDISKGASSQKNYHQGISCSDRNVAKTVVVDSEGDHLSPMSKCKQESADTVYAPPRKYKKHMDRRVKVVNDFLNTTKSSENESNNHLKMQTKINLHMSGLRPSPRLKEPLNTKGKAHTLYGTRAKKAGLGLLAIISLVSKVSMPSHQRKSNETYLE